FQVERFHQLAEAASRYDDVFYGHCAVVEVEVAARHPVKAHQALRAAKAQSRRVAFYVDCPDAFRTRFRAQAAVNDVSISVTAAGSDIDTATISSPRQTRGTTRCRRDSAAKRSIARTGPTQDSKTGKASAEEHLPNSSNTSRASRLPRPSPP